MVLMTPHDPQGEVTRCLAAIQAGDHDARGRLFSLVYTELRERAHGLVRCERNGCSLQTTDLLHELCARWLTEGALDNIASRGHLIAASARAMCNILKDHARRRKVRGGPPTEPLDQYVDECASRGMDLVELHDALQTFAAESEQAARACQWVELRFYGGLTHPQIAELVGVSLSTVEKEWNWARVRLWELMTGERKS